MLNISLNGCSNSEANASELLDNTTITIVTKL